MKKVFLILTMILLASGCVFAESVYVNGSHAYIKSGNTVYGPNNSTYTQVGNTVYGSDGSTVTKFGDHVYVNTLQTNVNKYSAPQASYLPSPPPVRIQPSGYELHQQWKSESGFKY